MMIESCFELPIKDFYPKDIYLSIVRKCRRRGSANDTTKLTNRHRLFNRTTKKKGCPTVLLVHQLGNTGINELEFTSFWRTVKFSFPIGLVSIGIGKYW